MSDAKRHPRVFEDWRHFVAFGLGSGTLRFAPGTWGTVAAVPFYWLLLGPLPAWLYAVTVCAAFALGVWLCETVSRDLGVHDHGGIVFDEFVGYWIAMFMLPTTWAWTLAGFVAFRLFDIWKPWPIRWFDRNVHGGLGIMLDDVAAGAAACLALHAIRMALGL